MKPDSQEPADLLNLLRQQLILAQVRIMELEDERDSLTPRLAELTQLLAAAQSVADRKLDEVAHLEKVLADTRAHAANLQGLQLQTTQELATLRESFAQAEAEIGRRQAEVDRLASELLALKSSRSWRWTAWLRRLGGKQA